MINKEEIFKNELDSIVDLDLNRFARFCMSKVANYFFKVPASTSGKYHPTYALGKGGLVRHTKAAVKVALSILDLDFTKSLFEDYEVSHDVIIFALIFHDCCKTNGGDTTVFEHPILASNFIQSCYQEFKEKEDIVGSISLFEKEVKMIELGISSHMGQWNRDTHNNNSPLLPLPITKEQRFIHLCDYLASRKFINMEV